MAGLKGPVEEVFKISGFHRFSKYSTPKKVLSERFSPCGSCSISSCLPSLKILGDGWMPYQSVQGSRFDEKRSQIELAVEEA